MSQHTPIYLNIKTMHGHRASTQPERTEAAPGLPLSEQLKRQIRQLINFFKYTRKAATRGCRGAPCPRQGELRAASGQGAAEGLPALASPPRPRSLRALGEDGKEEGGGSTPLPSLPAGGISSSATQLPPAPLTVKARLRALLRELDGGHRHPQGRSPAAPHLPSARVPSATAGGARPAPRGRLRGPGQRLWPLFERGAMEHQLEG